MRRAIQRLAIDVARVALGGFARRLTQVRVERSMRRTYPSVRFERGARISGTCAFGDCVHLMSESCVQDVQIGRYTYVAAHSHLSRCTIGGFCSIGPRVRAGLGRHPSRRYVSTHPLFYSSPPWFQPNLGMNRQFEELLPIVIGNDVWIGADCTLLDGARIGDGVILGAGALVAGEIPEYTVAGGVPARVIRDRFSTDEKAYLRRLAWWDKDISWIRQHAALFHDVALLMATVP